MLETVISKHGIPIRLTDERWSHITEEHCELAGMAEIIAAIQDYINLIPVIKQTPQYNMWTSYDHEADVLYINFKKPSHATDSELLDNDVIMRYENEQLIGITILHAGKR